MKHLNTKSLVTAAVCLALCLVLPFLTGQIPQIGSALSPMHIPVLLAGFLCGPWWAAAAGAIAPLLRFFLFHSPALYPTGIAMCFELATYGLISGLLYQRLSKRPVNIYVSLIAAMLAGRVVWGVARVILSSVSGELFTWEMFMAGAFLKAIPGIAVQIVLVPLLVMALKRAGFFERTVPLPA